MKASCIVPKIKTKSSIKKGIQKKIRIPAFLSSGKTFTVVPERECKIYFFINFEQKAQEGSSQSRTV